MGVRDGSEKFEERSRADALSVLRKSLSEVERALGKGGLTTFGQAEALTRKRAIEKAIERLEVEIPKVVERNAADAASAASRVEVRVFGEVVNVSVEINPKAIAQASASAAEAVVGVTDGLRKDLNRAVLGAASGAYDRAQFDAKIRDAFDGDILEHRVERIARTEMARVFMGQQAATDVELATMPGVDLIKRWVKSGKGPGRSRPDHDAIDGQERELDEPFDLGGGATAATPPGGGAYQPMTPSAPDLPAGEVVNCGCDYVKVPRSEAQQPYISKAPRPAPAPANDQEVAT